MKFLIIGAGMIGRTHAAALQTLGLPFAVCDAKEENARALCAEYGVSEWYADYGEAVAHAGADAAIICTPNHLHAGPAVCAMEHGMDVLCEKPMAATAEQAREIYSAQQRTGRTLMVGYIVRSYAALSYVRRILDEGSLGRIVSARCVLATPETLDLAKTSYRRSYATGGGIIYDYTHELDYCGFLLGEAETGAAFCGSYLRKELSVDDSADVMIQYRSGAVLQLHMDYIQAVGRCGHSRSFEIIAEKGVLSCDFHTVKIDYNDGKSVEETFELDWNTHFVIQLKRFLAVVNGEPESYVTAREGLRIMEMADELYTSARTRTFVSLR